MNFVNLRKTGNSWEFATEADLEDFVCQKITKYSVTLMSSLTIFT
jgi:hypothetical protein